jgi:hypothetical protein
VVGSRGALNRFCPLPNLALCVWRVIPSAASAETSLPLSCQLALDNFARVARRTGRRCHTARNCSTLDRVLCAEPEGRHAMTPRLGSTVTRFKGSRGEQKWPCRNHTLT